MRSCADPDYVYRPWSDEQRKKLVEAQRARFAPKGFRQVYGLIIPDRWAEIVRRAAELHRQHHTIEQTKEFAKDLLWYLEYHDAS